VTERMEAWEAWDSARQDLADNRAMLETEQDDEFREVIQADIEVLEAGLERLDREIKALILPPHPNEGRNSIVEIRPAAGGDEAGLFAGDLFRMYQYYAERNGWKVEVLSSNPQGIGGFREIIFLISGKDVYGKMKFEAGVHRVQRVPLTEASGRIHTSAASVAVLPEAEDIDITIDPNDLRIDVFRSSGPGGQRLAKSRYLTANRPHSMESLTK